MSLAQDRIVRRGSDRLRSRILHAIRIQQANYAEELINNWVKTNCANPHGEPLSEAGVLLYSTSNLGDEIQSLAAASLLPARNILGFDRDWLRSASCSDNLPVMMNGWFGHYSKEWPPSLSISPIFQGFHIARQFLYSEQSINYLQRYQPIGCRDYTTVEGLASRGVKSYFSGCPTITFTAQPPVKRRGIYFVDCETGQPDGHIRSVYSLFCDIVPQEIRRQGKHITHNVPAWMAPLYGLKIRKAIQLLERYKRAELVVTSRLHCALPCLAYGTPCIFINHDIKTDERLNGLADFLYCANQPSDLADYPWKTPISKNKPPLANKIIEDVNTIIRSYKL